MPETNFAFASATEILKSIRSKKISPIEITRLYLDRIERLNPQLNSYLTIASDQAIKTAKSAEQAVMQGDKLGPLHGIPISIKDLESTKGIRTTGGSLIFNERIPTKDSIVVERVKKAGAIILGKTNTSEFGLLGRTENLLGNPSRNPWNPEYTAGGSSGGSASALVAGLCPISLGSDGGGSIRIPSSFCGSYGLKPTQGRTPQSSRPNSPFIANRFNQSGPMTRTVQDAALLLHVLAGYDKMDPSSLHDIPDNYPNSAKKSIKGLRIGWSPDFGYAVIDKEVLKITKQAAEIFEDLGCHVDYAELNIEPPFEAFLTLFSAEAIARSPKILLDNSKHLTSYAKEFFEKGSLVSGTEYAHALGVIDLLNQIFTDVFEKYDLILTPTTAVTAFPHGKPPDRISGKNVDWYWGSMPHTFPINMIGNPAASIPCGFSSNGMPVGLHIIGRKLDESTILAASTAFETAKPWAYNRPPIS